MSKKKYEINTPTGFYYITKEEIFHCWRNGSKIDDVKTLLLAKVSLFDYMKKDLEFERDKFIDKICEIQIILRKLKKP